MAIINSVFFDQFPKLKYDINHGQYPTYDTVTDIFFRIGMIKTALNNISSYYVYEVQDGETPDILAAKIYEDSSAGWMIIYANEIFDPQWDWPLDYKSFNKYITKKYGSIEASKTGIHHYDKVITRTVGDYTTTTRFEIDKEKKTLNSMDVPYNYFIPYAESLGSEVDSTTITIDTTLYTVDIDFDYSYRSGSIPITQDVRTYNIDGTTVTEVIKGEPISFYDYENDLNEKKRLIKVIKKDYYIAVMRDFFTFTYDAASSQLDPGSFLTATNYLRRLN
jgi:hypothetical protein